MGAGAFELAYEVADTDLRLDVDRHVNVRRRSADAMQEYSSNFVTAIVEKLIDFGFERSRNQWLAVFGMPIQVQKNLMEDVAGHGAISRGNQDKSLLKQAEELSFMGLVTTS
jgi:hypothetical protein